MGVRGEKWLVVLLLFFQVQCFYYMGWYEIVYIVVKQGDFVDQGVGDKGQMFCWCQKYGFQFWGQLVVYIGELEFVFEVVYGVQVMQQDICFLVLVEMGEQFGKVGYFDVVQVVDVVFDQFDLFVQGEQWVFFFVGCDGYYYFVEYVGCLFDQVFVVVGDGVEGVWINNMVGYVWFVFFRDWVLSIM